VVTLNTLTEKMVLVASLPTITKERGKREREKEKERER
jgi:hypothetical protein